MAVRVFRSGGHPASAHHNGLIAIGCLRREIRGLYVISSVRRQAEAPIGRKGSIRALTTLPDLPCRHRAVNLS